MFFSRSSSSKSARRGETPLERKQAALSEKERQLRLKFAQLEQLIEDAPRMRQERTRLRREELAADTRLNSSRRSLTDRRHDVSTGVADRSFGTRPLRSEKRDGKLLFVFLCFVLVLLFYGIWTSFVHFAH